METKKKKFIDNDVSRSYLKCTRGFVVNAWRRYNITIFITNLQAIRLRTLNTALREDVSEKTEREEEERKSSSDDGNLREENPLDHAKVQLLENSVNESSNVLRNFLLLYSKLI